MKMVTHITQQAVPAAALAVAGLGLLMVMHVMAEPQLTHSQTLADTSDEFTIRQTITDESSFSFQPTDVVMAGSINGITGGQATGTTEFAVQTNNSAGYRVDIGFFDNAGDQAMLGDTNADDAILNYLGDVGGEPSFGYTANAAAQFAYTVESVVGTDTDQSFLNDGTNCNAGGGSAVPCWKAPDEVTDFTIVQRGAPALTGATSTIIFNVTVPNAAVPIPEADTYTATATLSLFTL